jgi:hypothetical protein
MPTISAFENAMVYVLRRNNIDSWHPRHNEFHFDSHGSMFAVACVPSVQQRARNALKNNATSAATWYASVAKLGLLMSRFDSASDRRQYSRNLHVAQRTVGSVSHLETLGNSSFGRLCISYYSVSVSSCDKPHGSTVGIHNACGALVYGSR